MSHTLDMHRTHPGSINPSTTTNSLATAGLTFFLTTCLIIYIVQENVVETGQFEGFLSDVYTSKKFTEKNTVHESHKISTKTEAPITTRTEYPPFFNQKTNNLAANVSTCDNIYRKTVFDNSTPNDLTFMYDTVNHTSFKPDPEKYPYQQNKNCFYPTYCSYDKLVHIIVPYRDRIKQKAEFSIYMEKFLKVQHRAFCIIYVEQFDKQSFNRAKLMNIGADLAMMNYENLKVETNENTEFTKPEHCFIFHDVDLMPLTSRNLYTCFTHQAIHLCDKIDRYGFKTKHISGGKFSSGGAISISEQQFRGVNGWPNRFFGWGVEDHDMTYRLLKYKNWDQEDFIKNKWLADRSLTSDGGSKNLLRASRYGYYHQKTHARPLSRPLWNLHYGSEYESFKHFLKIGLREFFFDKDGLNSLRYEVVGRDLNDFRVTVEVRPYLRKMSLKIDP